MLWQNILFVELEWNVPLNRNKIYCGSQIAHHSLAFADFLEVNAQMALLLSVKHKTIELVYNKQNIQLFSATCVIPGQDNIR